MKSAPGKVSILSIDAGSSVLAAVSLARIEASLAEQCGNPTARIADFFDLAAGSGDGGVLAAMLFARAPEGRPLFSAVEALQFIMKNHRKFPSAGKRKRVFRRSGGIFRRLFGELTIRDTIKPLLVPCYDLATRAPFVFSRADAAEGDAFDFWIRDVCTAACAEKAAAAALSVDGRTRIRAVGGSVAMRNPTATAITHVLNNKPGFPFASGVGDLLVVSLGSGGAELLPPVLFKIAGECAAEAANWSGSEGSSPSPSPSEELMMQRSVESVMFRGRKMSEMTNGERLEWLCGELIAEHDRRKGSSVATVLIKPTVTSSVTTFTITSTTLPPALT